MKMQTHKHDKNKSLNKKQNVLVLGGTGFIGRYVAKHLTEFGANVIIGTRKPNSGTMSLGYYKPEKKRCVILQNLKTEDDLHELLEGVDVVVNAVGILRQRWQETYNQVHHQAVKVLAEGCAQNDIRMIHVSALELTNPLKSGFASSKVKGEKALIASGANWALVRPSLVDGQGGFGASWFRRVAKWPVQFIPSNMKGVFTPIDANDLGEAIAKIALMKDAEKTNADRIYELGGTDHFDLKGYLNQLRPEGLKPVRQINIYPVLARIVSHICDLLHVTPFSFGHYELLEYGSAPKINHLEKILGRPARKIMPEKIKHKITVKGQQAMNEVQYD